MIFSEALYAQGLEKTLPLHNLATGENGTVTYFKDGTYQEEGLEEITKIMIDPDTEKKAPVGIDPKLLDFLYLVLETINDKHPNIETTIQIISAYRDPKTNERLRSDPNFPYSNNVAKKSQHTFGKAIDFMIPGISDEELRDIAWCLQKGGVGYYPEIAKESGLDYIHIDTGRVRFWGADFNSINCEDTLKHGSSQIKGLTQ
jgi:uncharacterized protein YcbK (DUF882 family)